MSAFDRTPEWFRDADGDGVGGDAWHDDCDPPEGWVDFSGDCDDWDDTVAPGAIEVCDGKDNDCDGLIDEGLPTCKAGRLGPTPALRPCLAMVPAPDLAWRNRQPSYDHGASTGSPDTSPWPPIAFDAATLSRDSAIASWLTGRHSLRRPGPIGYPNEGFRPTWEAWSAAVRPAVDLGWTGLWTPPGHPTPDCVTEPSELLEWAWRADPELRRCALPHLSYAERVGWFEVRTHKPPDTSLYRGDGGCPGPKPAVPPSFDEAAVRVEKLFAHWRVPRCGKVVEMPTRVPYPSLIGPDGAGTAERLGQLVPAAWAAEDRLHLLHQLAWEAHPEWFFESELQLNETPVALAVMATLTPEPTVRTCTWIPGRHPAQAVPEEERDRFFEIDWRVDPASGAIGFVSTPVSWR